MERRGTQGVWEGHAHTAVFKMDNKLRPTVQLMELCSVLCDNLDRSEFEYIMYIFITYVTNTQGEGNGNPLQYSCLGNPMDGGAWQAAVHGVTKSQTQLSDFTFTFHFHALEKKMATHSSIVAWRIPRVGAWWAAVYGVAQSRT